MAGLDPERGGEGSPPIVLSYAVYRSTAARTRRPHSTFAAIDVFQPAPLNSLRSTTFDLNSTTDIGRNNMTIDFVALQPLAALIAGILILLIPRLLNYVVAIYLILIGLIGLWPHLLFHPH
jgi:hypothetical protein